jgi:hypothetical protein
MTEFSRRTALALAAATFSPVFASAALAQDKGAPRLFKIITVRDEIVIGLDVGELQEIGGADAGAVAGALKHKGTLSAWQYASRKAANGDLEQAPLRKIGILANDSLRVEPYSSPLKVLPHE